MNWWSVFGSLFSNISTTDAVKYNEVNSLLINFYYGSLSEDVMTESKAVDISSLFSEYI